MPNCNRNKTIWKLRKSVFDATREFWSRSIDARSNARVSLELNRACVREVRVRPRVRARPISIYYYLFFHIFDTLFLSPLDKRERESEKEGKKKSRSAARGKKKK